MSLQFADGDPNDADDAPCREAIEQYHHESNQERKHWIWSRNSPNCVSVRAYHTMFLSPFQGIDNVLGVSNNPLATCRCAAHTMKVILQDYIRGEYGVADHYLTKLQLKVLIHRINEITTFLDNYGDVEIQTTIPQWSNLFTRIWILHYQLFEETCGCIQSKRCTDRILQRERENTEIPDDLLSAAVENRRQEEDHPDSPYSQSSDSPESPDHTVADSDTSCSSCNNGLSLPHFCKARATPAQTRSGRLFRFEPDENIDESLLAGHVPGGSPDTPSPLPAEARPEGPLFQSRQFKDASRIIRRPRASIPLRACAPINSEERETLRKTLAQYFAQGLIEPCDDLYIPQPLNALVGPLEEDLSDDTLLCATHPPGGSGKAPAGAVSKTRSGRAFTPRSFSEKSSVIRRSTASPPDSPPAPDAAKAPKRTRSKRRKVSSATVPSAPAEIPGTAAISSVTAPPESPPPTSSDEDYYSDGLSTQYTSGDSGAPDSPDQTLFAFPGTAALGFEPHSDPDHSNPKPRPRKRRSKSSSESAMTSKDIGRLFHGVSKIVKNATANHTSAGWKKAKLEKFVGGNFPAFLEDYRSTLAGASDQILIDQFPLYISQPEHLKSTLRRDAVESNKRGDTWNDFRTLALSRFVGSTDPYNSYLQHLRQWPPVTKPNGHSLRSLLDNLKQYRAIVDGFADRQEDKVGDTQLIDIFLAKIPSEVASNFNIWMAMIVKTNRPRINDLYSAINIYEKSRSNSQAPSGSALHYPLIGQYTPFKSSDTPSVGFVPRRVPFEEEEVDDVTKRKIKRRFYKKPREPSSSDDDSSDPEVLRPRRGKARRKAKPLKKDIDEPSHSTFKMGNALLTRYHVMVTDGQIRRVSCRFCRKTMQPGEDLKEHLDKCPLKDKKKCFGDGCDKIFEWETPAGKRAYFEHLAHCPKLHCGNCKKKGHSRARCPQLICEICQTPGHVGYACDHVRKQ